MSWFYCTFSAGMSRKKKTSRKDQVQAHIPCAFLQALCVCRCQTVWSLWSSFLPLCCHCTGCHYWTDHLYIEWTTCAWANFIAFLLTLGFVGIHDYCPDVLELGSRISPTRVNADWLVASRAWKSLFQDYCGFIRKSLLHRKIHRGGSKLNIICIWRRQFGLLADIKGESPELHFLATMA